MPGHHVRFSDANTFHSPPPPLSYSSPSATSSSGPFTPPSLPNVALPGPTPYAPRRNSTAAKASAHILVEFSDSPLLNYDIKKPPSSISTHFIGVSTAGLCESAVYPPQPVITLLSPHLPWHITVTATNGGYVTVSDVLNSVYRTLRVNVTLAEFNSLGTQKLMRRVTDAYAQRYARLKGHRGYTEEKRQGVKRIDFLMGCTKFHGISPASGSADVWQLNIA